MLLLNSRDAQTDPYGGESIRKVLAEEATGLTHKWETATDEKTKIMREKGKEKEERVKRFLSLQWDFK